MKAKFIKTEYVKDRFNPYKIKIYEYKGFEYQINFDLSNNYVGIFIDVKGEHIYQQDKIDKELADANKPKQPYDYKKSAEYGFKVFRDFCDK